jgi:hypothetical protein
MKDVLNKSPCFKKDCILVLKFQLMKKNCIDDLEMRPDVQEK